MSEDRSDPGLDSMEGWSIVRHRDDVGSDADSVEVISDDSDRDTCDEGKEACDDDHTAEIADSTTKESTSTLDEEEVGTTTDEGDLDTELVRLDPLGDLTQLLSDKLHEFLLIPRNVQNNQANQELKLRYVIFSSTLLALICSLLVSSYLLFHRFQELPEKRDDATSTQVLQELEQAISRLQAVLRVENNEHVKDSLSRMPPDYLSLDKMISNDRINRRKTLRRSHAMSTKEKEDFGVIMSIETSEITSDGRREGIARDWSSKGDKLTGNEMGQGTDQENSNLSSDQQLATDRPTNIAVDVVENTSKGTEETHNSDTLLPAQELKTQHGKNFKSQDHKKDSKLSNSDPKDILLSVRQDILSIQNKLYSQIMNNLFEYKIDLYKNLMRAGLDSTCNADHASKKSNHKKFMLIRNLQNMIAKSSESNFESWYKFYSYSVSPKFRTIVSKLDSITNNRREEKKPTQEGVLDTEKQREASATSDDFFVRSSFPFGGSGYEIVHPPASDGFDWKNLGKIIRDMNKARTVTKDNLVGKNEGEATGGDEMSGSGTVVISESNIYNNEKEPIFVDTGEKHNADQITVHRAFKESSSANSDESLKKESRKKFRAGNEDRKREQSHKLRKSTNKHDSTNERVEVKNQDNKKDFEKHNDGKRGNSENNSGEKEKGYGKRDEKDRMNGDNKEHFSKEYCSGGRCDKRGGKDYYFHDGRPRRKSFLNNMTKYVKKAASGLWKTVRGGFKKVKNYGSYIKDWHTGEDDNGKGNYEEWRKEFVKEMKDVIKVLGVNPAINGLYEFPKSFTRFFGDGLASLIYSKNWDEDVDSEAVSKGPAGVTLDECDPADGGGKMGSYGMCTPDDSEEVKSMDSDGDLDGDDDEEVDKASWYTEAAKHRAKSRGENYPGALPRSSDPSWFLGLGRHRSYLRRRGIHLDDDGSWFISSARHRAKLRQRHTNSPLFAQASSKRAKDNISLFEDMESGSDAKLIS